MSCESDLLREFKVVRFQPNDIILVHRTTKRPYEFYDQPYPSQSRIHPSIQHPLLLRGTLLSKGALYPYFTRTLQAELSTRMRAHNPIYFTED